MRRHAHWWWLLLILPIVLGLHRLRFDAEVLHLLPADEPVVQGLLRYQTQFGSGEELIITLKATESATAETASRELALHLRAQSNLVRSVAWQPYWLEFPALGAEMIAYLWLNQAPDAVQALRDRITGTNLALTIEHARELLATSFSPVEVGRRSYDPLDLMTLPEAPDAAAQGDGSELFTSPDGTFRLIFVEPRGALGGYRETAAWLAQVQNGVATLKAGGVIPETVRLGYTGRPAFVTEIATGMERDMTSSVGGTVVIIAALFWLMHRRWRPLLWLIALLGLILLGTLGLGGLFFGTLNVVSLGFAAILLGLAVDYGLVLYQEKKADPGVSVDEVRRQVGPGIIWAATTTAAAFAILNLGGLPGLAQLGSLVAIGIALGATVMLAFYLPLTARSAGAERPSLIPPASGADASYVRWGWALTLPAIVLPLLFLWHERPGFDYQSGALRPQQSTAFDALEEIKREMDRGAERLWLLVQGPDEATVARRIQEVRGRLEQAVTNGLLASFTLPEALWPQTERHRTNAPLLAALGERRAEISETILSGGFSPPSLAVMNGMFDSWRVAGQQSGVFWPTNEASRWALDKLVAHRDGHWVFLGFATPATNDVPHLRRILDWGRTLPKGTLLSGWEVLGVALFDTVQEHLPRLLWPTALLLIASLWMAFRDWREMVLSMAAIAASFITLWTIMDVMGWKWNLMNVMVLPLLLGAGVDYSIHMQLSLRRHRGHIAAARRGTGRALFLCGATTITGFGSLAWSSNAGMASLGKVCAAGIASCLFVAICLLPAWWRTLDRSR